MAAILPPAAQELKDFLEEELVPEVAVGYYMETCKFARMRDFLDFFNREHWASDIEKSLVKTAKLLGITHRQSQPAEDRTNTMAER